MHLQRYIFGLAVASSQLASASRPKIYGLCLSLVDVALALASCTYGLHDISGANSYCTVRKNGLHTADPMIYIYKFFKALYNNIQNCHEIDESTSMLKSAMCLCSFNASFFVKHMHQLIHLKLAVGKFKCASKYIHGYNLQHLIFFVFECRLIQHWTD